MFDIRVRVIFFDESLFSNYQPRFLSPNLNKFWPLRKYGSSSHPSVVFLKRDRGATNQKVA
jgi:hypothetical protein